VVPTKQPAQPTVVLLSSHTLCRATRTQLTISPAHRSRLWQPASERLPLGPLGRILLTLLHLLAELARLLLIGKAEAVHSIGTLEAVEEGAVLVVLEVII